LQSLIIENYGQKDLEFNVFLKKVSYNFSMSIFSPVRTKVAVLRGGPSEEYEVSLQTGKHILNLIREFPDIYEPRDIFISKNGEWHASGVVNDPHKVLKDIDVVFNALHGKYGEDGEVQKLLQALNIPFTGSSALSSAMAMNKHVAKDIYIKNGILTPQYIVLKPEEVTNQTISYIHRNFMHPVIVKPANAGSSIGVNVVHTVKELRHAISEAFSKSKKVLVEEVIRGKEATCGVVENARGEKLYALLPVEIKKQDKAHFFDYASKYSPDTEELCPGTFSTEENKQIENIAKKAHEALGLRHYSRSDFIVTNKGKIYTLETNSLPGFTENSLILKSLKAVGWPPKDFVDHILTLALD
jgi:D-alanine-D-alanine ligase